MAKRTCAIDGCGGDHYARGWCNTHYARWQNGRDLTSPIRSYKIPFWDRVDRGNDEAACWIWTGSKNRRGYGHGQMGGRKGLAHRLAWEERNGPIPPGLFVCHRCDNPSCVRPEHLHLGTHAENMAEMVARGRHYTRPAALTLALLVAIYASAPTRLGAP